MICIVRVLIHVMIVLLIISWKAESEFKKKDPITYEVSEKIIDLFGDRENNCDLRSVRTVAMLLISFAGFLRFSEVANLKVKNLVFKDLYMNIVIESSKTDVYRRGNKVTIAETGGKLCAVSWMKHYLKLTEINNPEEYVFRALRFSKSKNSLCRLNKGFIVYKIEGAFAGSVRKSRNRLAFVWSP